MRTSLIGLTAAAAVALTVGSASAMPLGGLGQAADHLSAVEKTQFVYLGRNYCWYPDGWHGPGFYWCGYAWRSGFGWGGPLGWRGWRHGGVGPRVVGPRMGGPHMGGGPRMMGPRMGGAGPRMGGGGGGGGRVGGGGRH
jgi:hypothetical protein